MTDPWDSPEGQTQVDMAAEWRARYLEAEARAEALLKAAELLLDCSDDQLIGGWLMLREAVEAAKREAITRWSERGK